MSRTTLAWVVALSTIAATPALAQTTPAQNPPAATSPAPTTATPAGADFITQAPVGQYRATKLVGVNIYNSDQQSIGEVNELVVDKAGNIKAVVIGVGGFLGIGQKNVALPYTAIKWEDKALQTATVGMAAPGTGTATTTAPAAGGGTTTATVPAADTTVRDYPDHGILDMTKEQLQSAPDFKFASEAAK
ncbi:PRC-barrel domain-containing protein [Labrys wisconsinensis]|uniref:Sporulation protein YlmC with PRC-barrel domain n=1 Tax=Labrys wisconsinensis TaxID=425677 RepID=A0ABU0JNG0_9HYPH|nr:PRC-barrel domain-containing protein [Labrys wisconsinensis]MDQ0474928.1 sporulation protein YlmC with PRC-barrel domain [Labrys wisconsinensis]